MTPTRTLRLSSPALPQYLGRDALTPVRLSGVDALNQLFTYHIDLKSHEASLPEIGANIDLNTLAGRDATVSIELDGCGIAQLGGGERQISALITEAAYLRPEGRHHLYRLTLRPWLWLATLTSDCKIFQDQSVIGIFDALLADYPYPVEKRLAADTYPVRDYTVQLGESDFHFFARLCEEWGIVWWFEHSEGKHRLILADGPGAHHPNPSLAYQQLDYYPPGYKPDAEYVHAFDLTERVTTGATASTDWDYTRARADLAVSAHDPRPTGQADFEAFLWPIDSAQPLAGAEGMAGVPNAPLAEGDLLVRRRLEALRQPGQMASGEGNLRGLVTGHTFTLAKHPRALANGEWLILGTRLLIEDIAEESQGSSQLADGSPVLGQIWQCTVNFTLQAANLPFRPALTLAKPRASMHRAVVTGPAGKEMWTDRLGRVKVAFPWDRYHQNNERSSAWLRVSSPWAGAHYGGIQTPRIGQEVLVDFEAGDPDRPLVTGRVVNNTQLPPWQLPENQALSGFRSKELYGHQANHLILDDSEGQIQAQLSSDHALSQLNLGHITRIPDEGGRRDQRGDGFELRTDAHGVIRAQAGLLITTEARGQAQSYVKSMGETQARLDAAQQQHEQLADLARQHQANEGQQGEVAQAIAQQNQAIQGHGAANPEAGQFPEFAQPHLTLASPAGIEATTPGSIHLAAEQHLAVTAGKKIAVAANGLYLSLRQGLRLFAHQVGIRLIAAAGDIDIRALKHSFKVSAKLAITETADTIDIGAKDKLHINGGGSYITFTASGIESGTTGSYTVHAASRSQTGPQSTPVDMPTIPNFDALSQQPELTLFYHYPDLTGVAGAPYRIVFANGEIREGKLDSNGKAHLKNVPIGEATVYYGETRQTIDPPSPTFGKPPSDFAITEDLQTLGLTPRSGEDIDQSLAQLTGRHHG